MKFIDFARITVKSGDGGDGHIGFRSEKFVPKGGPDGGNGGKGGNVVFKINPNMNTLLDFRYHRNHKAEDGHYGGKSKMSGRGGEDHIVFVPKGTLVKNRDTDEVIVDMADFGQEFIIAKGGNGGFGNAEFATSTNQAPRYAKPGLPGIEINLELELKLLADVGFVGFPNAGKSTLISVISEAKPKIADYPFTTLVPNLGIVKVGDFKNYTVADIPGLIEGAADGKGLGVQFLRHVERTSVLLFLMEAMSEDPAKEFETLYNELIKFNPEMADKKMVLCISKADTVTEERIEEIKAMKYILDKKIDIVISSVIGQGTNELKWMLWNIICEERDIQE